jgi:hypothetical protein
MMIGVETSMGAADTSSSGTADLGGSNSSSAPGIILPFARRNKAALEVWDKLGQMTSMNWCGSGQRAANMAWSSALMPALPLFFEQ